MIDDFITFKLFDKYNYRRMGLVDDWSLGDAVLVLASFDMQTNGLCELKDAAEHQSRLYNDYVAYVMSLIHSGKLKHDEDNNLINKDALLELMEANNALKLDIARLKRFLSCEEEPNISNPVKEITPVATVTNLDVESMTCNEKDAICAEELPRLESCHVSDAIQRDDDTVEIVGADGCTDESTDSQYRFIKIGHSWNIQFGNVELPGLKHMIGLDYIKLLLQNKYSDIGVLKLQALLNPENCKSSRASNSLLDLSEETEEDNDEPDYNEAANHIMDKLSDEDRSKSAILYKEVKETKAKLEYAREVNDTLEVGRLTAVLNIIQDDLYDILNCRNEDPELERNRKKVRKNIEDARKYIQGEELRLGYADTPTYNFLKKHIETGSTCKYNPLVEDPISWIF